MEAVQASLLLVVFAVLAGVFTELRAATPVTGCWILGFELVGPHPLSRLPSLVSGGSSWLPARSLVGVLPGLFFSRLPLLHSMR